MATQTQGPEFNPGTYTKDGEDDCLSVRPVLVIEWVWTEIEVSLWLMASESNQTSKARAHREAVSQKRKWKAIEEDI